VWDLLEVGLLHDLAALGFRNLGELLGFSTSAVAKRYGQHREVMRDPTYANIAGLTAGDALRHCYGDDAAAIAKSEVERRVSRKVEESA